MYTLFPHDEKAKANRNQTTCFYDKETAAKAITYLPKFLSFYLCNSRYVEGPRTKIDIIISA